MYKHYAVQMDWFTEENIDNNFLCNLWDIIVMNENSKMVTIIEIACSFDLYVDTCFTFKLLKYQPLV